MSTIDIKNLETDVVYLRIIIDEKNEIVRMSGPLTSVAQGYVTQYGYTLGQLENKFFPLWSSYVEDDLADLVDTSGDAGGGEVAKVDISKFAVDKQQVTLSLEANLDAIL